MCSLSHRVVACCSCACVQSFFSLGRVLIDTPLAFAICYVAAHAAFMTRSDAPLCVRCILIVGLRMATSRALTGVVLCCAFFCACVCSVLPCDLQLLLPGWSSKICRQSASQQSCAAGVRLRRSAASAAVRRRAVTRQLAHGGARVAAAPRGGLVVLSDVPAAVARHAHTGHAARRETGHARFDSGMLRRHRLGRGGSDDQRVSGRLQCRVRWASARTTSLADPSRKRATYFSFASSLFLSKVDAFSHL